MSTRPAGSSASSASPRSTCWSSTWTWTSSTRTRAASGARIIRQRRLTATAPRRTNAWHADSFASTSGPPRASARRTRCSRRAGGASSAAPTSSSASSRPTTGPSPRPCWRAWRSCPAGRWSTAAATFTEMDLDAVLARAPEVVLVDELAHTNVPGSRNAKRWQDIEELLDAGITVLTTVNIQHLESLNDVVATITGVPQRETVPDEVVRRAEQVELVDMTPEALRRRMAHGNVYQPEKVDAALGNYFRVGNLTALRELALLWLADKVDDQLDRYRAEHHIDTTWETRERIVVALTGGPEGDTLIRRGARVAARTKGADLMAVHVASSDGLAERGPGQPGPAAGAGREPRRHLPPGRRQRHPEGAARLRPRRQRHPAGPRREPTGTVRAAVLPRRRRHHHGRVRLDRRPPGHPRGGQAGPATTQAHPRRQCLPPDRRLRRRRRSASLR